MRLRFLQILKHSKHLPSLVWCHSRAFMASMAVVSAQSSRRARVSRQPARRWTASVDEDLELIAYSAPMAA